MSNRVGFELFELAEGGYTAAEFREANYDAVALKEVGFTARSLRLGGFNSRQLNGARYKLKEMREGGFPWQDLGAGRSIPNRPPLSPPHAHYVLKRFLSSLCFILTLVRPALESFGLAVIFLRSTYEELNHAGYTGLDPTHELFLLYRPERADDDETVPESPRHCSYAINDADKYLQVGAAPLQVRKGASLTSKRAGVLSKGAKVRVVNTSVWRGDGTKRLCLRSADPDAESQHLPIGWVTASFFSAFAAFKQPESLGVDQKLVQHEMLPRPAQEDDMAC